MLSFAPNDSVASGRPEGVVRKLRRFAEAPAKKEICDFCALDLTPQHRHLLELDRRRLVCVCDPCGLRFQDAIGARFKLIPREPRALPGFGIADAEWASLALPIDLAYFYQDSVSDKTVAMYPSPAGAMESLLPLTAWAGFVANNSELAAMAPDTEALLVNRVAGAREYFIAPLDLCYELVGLIRTHWRGFSGGETVWAEIEGFFARIRTLAVAPRGQVQEAYHA